MVRRSFRALSFAGGGAGYIHAVLHAPTHHAAYADFLRSDFPRIPFPENDAAFTTLAELGVGLVEVHLLRAMPKRGLGAFEGSDDQWVEAVRYSPIDHRIGVNATQGFRRERARLHHRAHG